MQEGPRSKGRGRKVYSRTDLLKQQRWAESCKKNSTDTYRPGNSGCGARIYWIWSFRIRFTVHPSPSGVNFTNVPPAAFMYVSCTHSFFVPTFQVCTLLAQDCLRKSCAQNVGEIDPRSRKNMWMTQTNKISFLSFFLTSLSSLFANFFKIDTSQYSLSTIQKQFENFEFERKLLERIEKNKTRSGS